MRLVLRFALELVCGCLAYDSISSGGLRLSGCLVLMLMVVIFGAYDLAVDVVLCWVVILARICSLCVLFLFMRLDAWVVLFATAALLWCDCLLGFVCLRLL